MNDNALYSLWMMTSVNPSSKIIYKMLRMFDSPLDAYRETLGKGLDPQYFAPNEVRAFDEHSLGKAEKMLEYCRRRDIDIITFYDETYPPLLRQIPTPPMALFVKGRLPDMDSVPSVTIIGTRNCSDHGRRMAARLAYDLSVCGITVVSGMARGIDTYAHKGCLLAGKAPTVAVLAGNVEEIYPPENRELYRLIQNNGAVVSENLPESPTVKWGFHQRNRILSGMTYATIVVESGLKGGSMITVRHALDQNKTVFAVPGEPGRRSSEGTNELIKNGAALCTDARDVINELRYMFRNLPDPETLSKIKNSHRAAAEQRREQSKSKLSSLSGDERAVYDSIPEAGISADGLCDRTGRSFPQIIRILQAMELKGCIKQVRGGTYVRIK